MRPEASRSAAIAARITDLDTQTGQLRQVREDGFILCERSQQRQDMRPHSSKFCVRPWERDPIRLIMKGLNPLVSGDAGADNDGRPLFLKAAEEYPERAEEFLGEVRKIDANREQTRLDRAKRPPTPAEMAEAQAGIIARGVGQALAANQGPVAGEANEPSGEVAPKRGGAEAVPRPTRARE